MKVEDMKPKSKVIPYNGKIADINESDTSKHYLDVQTALSENRTMKGMFVTTNRVSGTGTLRFYPNEGTDYISDWNSEKYRAEIFLSVLNNRVQYSQSVANDNFELYCWGYIVEV